MAPLSYLGFHAAFLLPPIAGLGWLAATRSDARTDRRAGTGLAIIVVLAVVYTTPWTNRLIPAGVWWYGDGVVRGRLWHTPLEEYLFFVLQPLLTALVLVQFRPRPDRARGSTPPSLRIPSPHRAVGAGAGLGIAGVGWTLLGTTSTYYLGAILLWAGPILAIQWTFGATHLWRARRTVLVAIAVPTGYLWVADRIALELGVWTISETHTTGYALVGLPIEEALFFLVTNAFVVQGLVLYDWLLECVDGRPPLERGRVSDSDVDVDADFGPEGPGGTNGD